MKAVLKEEYTDVRPESQFPQWSAHAGEDVEHLKGRMRNKGCDPDKYEWEGENNV
jgi:hypothetical protein